MTQVAQHRYNLKLVQDVWNYVCLYEHRHKQRLILSAEIYVKETKAIVPATTKQNYRKNMNKNHSDIISPLNNDERDHSDDPDVTLYKLGRSTEDIESALFIKNCIYKTESSHGLLTADDLISQYSTNYKSPLPFDKQFGNDLIDSMMNDGILRTKQVSGKTVIIGLGFEFVNKVDPVGPALYKKVMKRIYSAECAGLKIKTSILMKEITGKLSYDIIHSLLEIEFEDNWGGETSNVSIVCYKCTTKWSPHKRAVELSAGLYPLRISLKIGSNMELPAILSKSISLEFLDNVDYTTFNGSCWRLGV